jgi:tungstate transport system ATP-binding protein
MKILPLELRNASYFVRGTQILDSLSIQLTAGARTVVLGANGAGKSSFLRLCHGLLQPTKGEVLWHGNADAKLYQAFVFQRPILLRRSAIKNVVFALDAMGKSDGNTVERAMEALTTVGLAGKYHQQARSLSIGEQQKLAIARATALSPEVLFLDEPTSSLDPEATTEVELLINRLHDAGTKIIMTTHNLRQAKRLADEVVFIHKGAILETSLAKDFFEAPQSKEAASFLC